MSADAAAYAGRTPGVPVIDPGMSAAIAAAPRAEGEWPVLLMLGDIPLSLAADAWRAVADGLAEPGWHAYVREDTGIGVVWVRRRTPDVRQAQ